MERTCDRCGRSNRDAARYCDGCGAALPQPGRDMRRAVQAAGGPGELFVGRERELALLRAAVDHALAGRGRNVALAGEPGIG
jgi:hypothetical protein